MTKLPATVYVVFDTNVYVRAVAGLEDEHAAWGAMVRICHALVVSPEILEEYESTISEYGYSKYIIVLKGVELSVMQKLRQVDSTTELGIDVGVQMPDNDLPFIKAAIASGASYLVTKDDRHFLSKKDEIKTKHNITVVRPRQYCDICNHLSHN